MSVSLILKVTHMLRYVEPDGPTKEALKLIQDALKLKRTTREKSYLQIPRLELFLEIIRVVDIKFHFKW